LEERSEDRYVGEEAHFFHRVLYKAFEYSNNFSSPLFRTGMYYLRTRPKADAIQFTVDQEQLVADRMKSAKPQDKGLPQDRQNVPEEDDDEICLSCGA